MLPEDVVLDGYTLIQQHEVDHEFLLNGSPLSAETPLFLAATVFGIALFAIGLLSLAFRRGWPAATLVVAALLMLSKLLWMPFYNANTFSDFQVFGYTAKYYPLYWPAQSWPLIIAAIVALIVAIVAAATRRRRR